LLRLGESLVASGAIDRRSLDRARRVAAETGGRLDRVITFRCTKRVVERFRLEPVEEAPASTGILGDWYANLLNVGSQRFVLCVSERTLLPVILPAPQCDGKIPYTRSLTASHRVTNQLSAQITTMPSSKLLTVNPSTWLPLIRPDESVRQVDWSTPSCAISIPRSCPPALSIVTRLDGELLPTSLILSLSTTTAQVLLGSEGQAFPVS